MTGVGIVAVRGGIVALGHGHFFGGIHNEPVFIARLGFRFEKFV
jgi:hypothetical protein